VQESAETAATAGQTPGQTARERIEPVARAHEHPGRPAAAHPGRYPRIDLRPDFAVGDGSAAGEPANGADGWSMGDPATTSRAAPPSPYTDGQTASQPAQVSPGWSGTVDAQAAGQSRVSPPFSVLLIEVMGIDRLLHSDQADAVGALVDAVGSSLRVALRPLDMLEQDSPGRWWLLAPAADLSNGRMLAERLAEIVRATVSDRHAPVEVGIGVAASPDHGTGAVELGARAEEELYAARAAGLSVLPGTGSTV
jgi:GGDEF domain-containing protein